MPFMTSEIYSYLVNYDGKDIMISDWPTKFNMDCEKEIAFIETMKNIIVKVRNIRTNMNVHPTKKVELIFVTDKYENELLNSKAFIEKLAFGSELRVQKDNSGIDENAISVNENDINLYMPFNELVDLEEEKARLNAEKEKLEAEVERSNKILSNKGFVAKAPEEKIKEEKEKLEKYTNMLEDVKSRLAKI